MRKVRILATVIVTMLILTMSVSAARYTIADELEFAVSSPASAGGYFGGLVGGGVTGSAAEPGVIRITYWADADSAPITIKVLLQNAHYDLENFSLDELVTDFAKLWSKKTGGAPVVNAVVATLADVSIIGPVDDVKNGRPPITFTLDVPGIAAGDIVFVIHKVNGNWVIEENVAVADGKVTVTTVNGNSCFAVIVDNGAAPAVANAPVVVAADEPAETAAPVVVVDPAPAEAPAEAEVVAEAPAPVIEAVVAPVDAAPVVAEAPTSPQTGVNGVNVAIAAAVVMAALGSACIVKANRRHDA